MSAKTGTGEQACAFTLLAVISSVPATARKLLVSTILFILKCVPWIYEMLQTHRQGVEESAH